MAGLVALGYYWLVFAAKRGLPANDSLAPVLFAFVCFLIAGVTWVAGWGKTRALLFPLVFLFFMVPLPTVVVNGMETFLQRASASAADMLFSLSGTTYFRDGQVFVLPGLSIRVGQECSGIRSSFVLFMTSLLAAYMFLRRPWSRVLLAFSVIPLGIVRNGFRVFTIAMLTAHVDQGTIDSPLHHRGGPLFFALSLIPFFGLLWLLRAVERKKVTTQLGNRE